MAACFRPGGLAMIIRSHSGNAGKIVITLENLGSLKFRERGVLHNVWTVKAYGETQLQHKPWLLQKARERFGQHIDGFYAQCDLIPLGDPTLVTDEIAGVQAERIATLNERIAQIKTREREKNAG